MKKVTLIIGILLATNILFAQGRREDAKGKAKAKIEEYKERLNLSDEQLADIKEIREKYKPEMQEIRNDEATSKSDKMRAAADVIEKQEAEMAELLTSEQQEEWKEIRAEIKERREVRRERRRERNGKKDGK